MRKVLPICLLLLSPLAGAQELATVDGQGITEQQVTAINPAAKENPQLRQQVLQELINRTLLLRAAEKAKLDQTPAFQQTLAQQREQLLINTAAAHWLEKHPITPAEVQARYDQLVKEAPREQWRLREILVNGPDAAKILDQLRRGASFSDLAAQSSTGPNAALGGELGWVNPRQLPAPLADAAAKLKPGQVIGPIVTPQGSAIVQLLGRRPFVPAPLDAVREQLINQLRNEALNQYVAELRKQAKVVIHAGDDNDAQKP